MVSKKFLVYSSFLLLCLIGCSNVQNFQDSSEKLEFTPTALIHSGSLKIRIKSSWTIEIDEMQTSCWNGLAGSKLILEAVEEDCLTNKTYSYTVDVKQDYYLVDIYIVVNDSQYFFDNLLVEWDTNTD